MMCSDSDDATYTALIGDLRDRQKALADSMYFIDERYSWKQSIARQIVNTLIETGQEVDGVRTANPFKAA